MEKFVLVNGDDMLFKCPTDFYPIFLETAKAVGFKISQGKNYLSTSCCLINSQFYQRKGGRMTRVGYLNMRLVSGYGTKKGETAATPDLIGKDLGLMVEQCPWTRCCIPHAFKRWNKDWFSPNFTPNWYLPVHLGGFGVPLKLAPPAMRITRAQRLMAARFVSDPRMTLYRRLAEKGVGNLPLSKIAGSLLNWRLVPGDYVPECFESTQIADSWLERLAYAWRATGSNLGCSDRVMCRHFKPEYRLKPMSMATLESYMHAQLFATRVPGCPAQAPITLKARWGDEMQWPKTVLEDVSLLA